MRTLLLAASVVILPGVGGGQAAGQGPEAAARLSLLDVPYLSQSEALCGGAAAAMVLRYWGARGVAAEDFAPLIDSTKGGIEAAALARAIQERGYQSRPASGTEEMVRRELADGRPVIVLIEDRPGAFHYVVVVGWHARAVVLHDPARTPYVLLKPTDFARRWKASRSWMLAVAPPSDSESRLGVPTQSPSSESQLRVPARSPSSESQLGVPARSPSSESQLGVVARSPSSESQLGVPARSPNSESQLGVGATTSSRTASGWLSRTI